MPRYQIFFALLFVLAQCFLLGVWFFFSTPQAIVVYPGPLQAFQACNDVEHLHVLFGLGYPLLLIITCTALATINREIPTGFNEARRIGKVTVLLVKVDFIRTGDLDFKSSFLMYRRSRFQILMPHVREISISSHHASCTGGLAFKSSLLMYWRSRFQTLMSHVREIWISNSELAKSFTALQMVRTHRFNIHASSCVAFVLCRGYGYSKFVTPFSVIP